MRHRAHLWLLACALSAGCVSRHRATTAVEIAQCVAPRVFCVLVQDADQPLDLAPNIFTNGAIQFEATLVNRTTTPVSFSLSDVGNVTVDSFSKDGHPLAAHVENVEWGQSPRIDQMTRLTALAPQQAGHFTIGQPWSSVDGSTTSMRVFQPAGEGEYHVTFVYHYSGPDHGHPAVSHDTYRSNEVTFRVRK